MKASENFQEDSDFYSVRRVDDILVLHFEKELMIHLAELRARDRLLAFFDRVSADDAIKIMVIINSAEKRGCDEYYDFYCQALTSKLDRKAIHRMHNILDQLILKIVYLDKVTVHVDCGVVIPLFLNISLACDFRIVSENTVFQNPYLDLGLLPKGGSAFFLCRILGHSKACKLLMLGEEIWADQALTLGMVDEVVPIDRLEESAIEFARRLVQKPPVTLSGIKRLLNYFTKDLRDYLDFENQELMKIVGSSEFSADSPIELREKLRKDSLSKTKP